MQLDKTDKQILAALDDDFIVNQDNETATLTGNIKIEVTRPDTDRLLLLIEFAHVEFPILMSRTKTLAELNIGEGES